MTTRSKPILIFDGDCGFCRAWIARWQVYTGDRVDYAPYQEVKDEFPAIPVEEFQKAVKLVEPDGAISSGAKAVLRSLSYAPSKKWLFWLYRSIPGFAPISEAVYRFVASHRPFAFQITRLLWGRNAEPSRYSVSQWLFLRSIAVIYLIAFLSLWVQVHGLVGSNGIMPTHRFLDFVAKNYGSLSYFLAPTLCWLGSSDAALTFLCAGGAILSILLLFGITPGFLLFWLWAFYLSLVVVCRDFLAFQWDVLLLEAGFLSIFLYRPFARNTRNSPINRCFFWLLKWLLFRLTFSSGMVKLLSGDPTWRNLTALNYHYWTQPLPSWVGWYANLLPEWFQKFSVAGMFAIELVAPFLIFFPRRPRLLAFWMMVILQMLILLTGNYAFFNLLTIALCFLLVDDRAWRRKSFTNSVPQIVSVRPIRAYYVMAAILFVLSCLHFSVSMRLWSDWPGPVVKLYELADPFRSVNGYGLFAQMTTQRDEIIIEGSEDGTNWKEYEFNYKPGDLKRRPGFVEPHQPRLDWQMWFAALSSYENNRWFLALCYRILEGSPQVLDLLEKNPFPGKPPKYLRASLYAYHFSNLARHREEGVWWERSPKGLYCPVLSMRNGPEGPELFAVR
jgi:predicted DCC family thiol-disulfide oxidoreductase YuxK